MHKYSGRASQLLSDIYVPVDAPGASLIQSLLDEVVSELSSLGITTTAELHKATSSLTFPIFREITILKGEGRSDEELTGQYDRLGKVVHKIWEPYILGIVWSLLEHISILLREPCRRCIKQKLSKVDADLGLEGQPNLVVALCYFGRAQNYYYDVRTWSGDRRVTISTLGNIASAIKWRAPRGAIESLASDLWETDGENPRSISIMTQALWQAVEDDPQYFSLEKVPAITTIRKWVKRVAPDGASKPGRPKKKN